MSRSAHTSRRIVAWVATGLLATMLPLALSTTGPAAAAACLDETAKAGFAPLLTGCDDVTPPHATITNVTPTPNTFGFIRSSTVTFEFTGQHTDADTGTIEFECQFYKTTSQPGTWDSCSSPKNYGSLADSKSPPYTFRVRAIDATDHAVQACDENAWIDACLNDPDVADYEAIGDVTTLKIDTLVPNTFLTRAPTDKIRPDAPVVRTDHPRLVVNSNEDVHFACTVNGKALTFCDAGVVELPRLKPGSATFIARAVDRAGNVDPTPATTTFFVPKNIRKNTLSPWRKRRQIGLFGNDYLTANRVGQTLVVKGIRKVREVRILAPTGPRYGKIEVKVGRSQWYTVNLFSKKNKRLKQLLVRDQFSPLQTGKMLIRVKSVSRKRPSVRIDALVARG